MKIWRQLTRTEITGLSEGDPVVICSSSRGAFQWHPSQRLKPEVITFTKAEYVEKSKRASIRVLEEGSDIARWVGTVEVGRYEEA